MFPHDSNAVWTFAARCLLIGILAVSPLCAQTLLTDPKKIADARQLIEAATGRPSRCHVWQTTPQSVFSLRLQAGYIAQVPLTARQGPGQRWIVLTRIAPKDGNGEAAYLSDEAQFPPVGDRTHAARVEGSYWLGEGRYSVSFLMLGAGGDVCRSQWEIDARLNTGVRNLEPMLGPGMVRDVSWNGENQAPAAKSVGRMTVLLHAASALQMQTILRTVDKVMLLDAVVALMKEARVRSIRLVVFNLEQQKELFRSDSFTLEALPEVSEALNALQPAAVDYSAVRNPASSFVETLANREIQAADPTNAVVFLGPKSFYKSKPSAGLALPPGSKQQFFYLVCESAQIIRPPSRSTIGWQAQGAEMGFPPVPRGGTIPERNIADGPSSNYGPNHGPDAIEFAVGQLKGKTMQIDSAWSFASAVTQIARQF